MLKNKKKDWVRGSTCVYNVGYHIVWSTKYRREVLIDDVETYLKEVFREIEKKP